jgi:uncharacterized protein (DUF305 family)
VRGPLIVAIACSFGLFCQFGLTDGKASSPPFVLDWNAPGEKAEAAFTPILRVWFYATYIISERRIAAHSTNSAIGRHHRKTQRMKFSARTCVASAVAPGSPVSAKIRGDFARVSRISVSGILPQPFSAKALKMFNNVSQQPLDRSREHQHKLRAVSGTALLLCAMLIAASVPVNVFGSPLRAAQTASASQPVVVQPGAPGKPSKTLPPSTTGTLPARSQADVDFMQGMIMHHSQAVEMTALIPSHTDNKDIRLLGAKISSSQSDEIKFMQRWLAARGESTSMAMPGMSGMDASGKPMALMPGMLTPEQMEALRNAKGAEFDHLFLTGMIQHHNGALIMVKDLFDTAGAGQEADIFNFATDADNTQRAEIKIMQSMLEKKSPEEKR